MRSIYPYRFKTNDELVKEFGQDWKYNAFRGVGWNDEMDHLLGKEYPYFKDQLNMGSMKGRTCYSRLSRNDDFRDINGGTWAICWDMLTPNIVLPNYKSKEKIVRSL